MSYVSCISAVLWRWGGKREGGIRNVYRSQLGNRVSNVKIQIIAIKIITIYMDNLPIDIRTKENRNNANQICACYGAKFFQTSLIWNGL